MAVYMDYRIWILLAARDLFSDYGQCSIGIFNRLGQDIEKQAGRFKNVYVCIGGMYVNHYCLDRECGDT